MDCFPISLGNEKCVIVYRAVYEPVLSNMYVIIQNGEAVVIDPFVSCDLENLLSENGVEKVYILLTHEHYDHTSGVEWISKCYDIEIVLTVPCAELVQIERNNNPMLVAFVLAEQDKVDGGSRYSDFKKQFHPFTIIADETVEDNETIELLDHSFTFRYTPGHSPGSCCIELDDIAVWTGDSLIKDTQTILRFKESCVEDYQTITIPYLKGISENKHIFPGHYDPFFMKEIALR